MAINLGKKFEDRFKQDWFSTFPDSVCIRLPDQQSGYYGSRNISDYICYKNPNLFFCECKSIQGNTFPVSNYTQYAKMNEFVGKSGVRCGVIVWFVDHQKVFYIPTSTFTKMIENKKKSFNVKDEGSDEYKSYLLKSTPRRLFLTTDYSILANLSEGE